VEAGFDHVDEIARVGGHLLADPYAAVEGFQALEAHTRRVAVLEKLSGSGLKGSLHAAEVELAATVCPSPVTMVTGP